MTKSPGTILNGERRPEGLAHGSSGQGAGMAPGTPRLLLIDNYDSFTYNLVQAFLVLGADVHVYRNDAMTVEEALAFAPSHLCISPGPGTPYDAGVSMDMIRAFSGRLPVLGVCLGHQSIVEVFGGKVVRAGRLMHGKTSMIQHDGRTLFEGLPQPCEVGRYHSLIAAPETLPPELEVTARTAEGEIMGVRHRTLMVEGVQFHPESILTPDGPALMKNFLGFRGGQRGRGSVVGASDAVSA
jgi:anthranilate synthase/aminodeoxychorismate synthase-like glutamine amidotransferase